VRDNQYTLSTTSIRIESDACIANHINMGCPIFYNVGKQG